MILNTALGNQLEKNLVKEMNLQKELCFFSEPQKTEIFESQQGMRFNFTGIGRYRTYFQSL
jgi:hypothetical protein